MPYPYRSFREWVADEEKMGNVIRIKKPVKAGDYSSIVDIGNSIPGKVPQSDIRAIARYCHSLPNKPMAIVEKPVNNRPDIPVVVNPFPTRERVYEGMGVKNREELAQKFLDVYKNRKKTKIVDKSKAACKQVIIKPGQVDQMKDIPRVWVEFNQCLWSGANGTWVTYDPETKTHGLGKTRWGQMDMNNLNTEWSKKTDAELAKAVKELGFCTVSRKYRPVQGNAGRFFYDHYRLKNKPMPCCFIYGVAPDIHVAAAIKSLRWPENGDEYELVGSFRGEPLEVVETETIPGMYVPAEAEYIIEGEMLPEDYTTPPFGEDVGLGVMIGDVHWPMFRAKCITHRKDPWWSDATFSSSGMHGHLGTHTGLVQAVGETDCLNYLRQTGFQAKDVVTHAGLNMTVLQMAVDGDQKPVDDYGKKAAMTTAGSLKLQFGLFATIVVGPDIDPYDPDDLLWAIVIRGKFTQGVAANAPFMMAPPIDALIATPKLDQMTLMMSPKPGMTPTGMLVRTDPSGWEKQAIERVKKELA
jgi:3-polyprenyl-4-hydroxybenzoate decarboxylase